MSSSTSHARPIRRAFESDRAPRAHPDVGSAQNGAATPPRSTASSALLVAAVIAMASLAGLLVLRIAFLAQVDRPITLLLNTFARRSPLLDYTLRTLDEYNLFQGVPVLALAYGAAVKLAEREQVRLAAGCAASAAAALLSRGLQIFLPNLPRPLFDPSLPFRPPYGADLTAMHDWSSFPSDHAALLFGVAAAIFLADRRLGLLALAWVGISSAVRLYGGLHYMTDIAGGAMLALALVCAATLAADRWWMGVSRIARRWPAWTAAACFVFAVQAASLFDDVRMIGASAAQHSRVIHRVSQANGAARAGPTAFRPPAPGPRR